MKWIDAIVNILKPDFGGVATFCEDPDGILDMPDVREALRAAGMRVVDWDGSDAALRPLQDLAENDMPLLAVPDGPHRHVAQGVLQNYAWHSVSIGSLFGKLSNEIVRSVPLAHWDKVRALNGATRVPQNADDTAILIARAVYRADPLFLDVGDGWLTLLQDVAKAEEGLPLPIAQVITRGAPEWLGGDDRAELLAEPAAARGALAVLKGGPKRETAEPSPVPSDRRPEAEPTEDEPGPAGFDARIEPSDNAERVLQVGLDYCRRVADGTLAGDARLDVNAQFRAWVEASYGLMLSSYNPLALRVSNLVEQLDRETGEGRLLLIVVDGLGLAAWQAVQSRWRQDAEIGRAQTRAAFAIIPTITSLSRRAIFEGRPPSQFGQGHHTPRLERELWARRFGGGGAYFASSEMQGLKDAFARAVPRLAVVDTDWDRIVHSLDPGYHPLFESASGWAAKTGLLETIARGFDAGYRVVITADHGQVACTGAGRPVSGELTDERSRRVLLFPNPTLRDSFISDRYSGHQPPGLPPSCCPLFCVGFDSFDRPDVFCYSHGGLSIEEVLVPVAEVFAR